MSPTTSRKVLVLGAGLVSAPVVEYLTSEGIHVTVASALEAQLNTLCEKFNDAAPILCDVSKDKQYIEQLVGEHDLTISLLPYVLHPEIAKMCIRQKKDLVTPSYLSQEMKELHTAAVEADIIVLNEMGLDPGIDHLLAMDCIQQARDKGGKIVSFISWCGGLPAAEFSDNPLRYRFSWSPRGVLHNLRSGARWLQDGEVREVAPGLLLDCTQDLNFYPGFNLEGHPNRDSLIYTEQYSLGNVDTLLRGTIRFKGFAEAAKALLRLGLTEPTDDPLLRPDAPVISWREFIATRLGLPKEIEVGALEGKLYSKLENSVQFNCIKDLGLLDDTLIEKKGAALDSLSCYLNKRLTFGDGEYDMIILRHDVGICLPDGTVEMHHLDLVVYGEPNRPGFSAMAKTVGYTAAIAAKMILDGEIERKGVVLPLTSDIYKPLISRLKLKGINPRIRKTSAS